MDSRHAGSSSLQLHSRCPRARAMAATAGLEAAAWLLHGVKLAQPCGAHLTPAEDLVSSDLLDVSRCSKPGSPIRSQSLGYGSFHSDRTKGEWRDTQTTRSPSSRGIHPRQAVPLPSPGTATHTRRVRRVALPPRCCSACLETRRRSSGTTTTTTQPRPKRPARSSVIPGVGKKSSRDNSK